MKAEAFTGGNLVWRPTGDGAWSLHHRPPHGPEVWVCDLALQGRVLVTTRISWSGPDEGGAWVPILRAIGGCLLDQAAQATR